MKFAKKLLSFGLAASMLFSSNVQAQDYYYDYAQGDYSQGDYSQSECCEPVDTCCYEQSRCSPCYTPYIAVAAIAVIAIIAVVVTNNNNGSSHSHAG